MLMLITLLAACKPAEDAPEGSGNVVVYAIRHVEKDTTAGVQDPKLTDEGTARAQVLATFMADVDLSAVYSTPYSRTRDTVQPVADSHGLEVNTQWAEGGIALSAHILATHHHETVIAAGHSNTVPALIAGLGGPVITIEESSYGELWVVTVVDGVATAVKTPFED